MRFLSRILIALTIALFAFAAPAKVGAAPDTTAPQVREVTVLLDSLPLAFPVPPFLEEDVTMVPLRVLSESLGFEVVWTGDTSPIECVKDGRKISLRLGDASAFVEENGTSTPTVLPKAAHLQGDTTVVPLSFFSETLGYQVGWDAGTYTADVKSPKSPMQVWGFYALGSAGYSSWEDLFGREYAPLFLPDASSPASKMAGSFLGWFGVKADGSIYSSGHPSGFSKPDGWEAVLLAMRAAGSKPVAMFYADNAGDELSAILSDPVVRDRLALNMATAVTVDYDGAAVDFEGLGLTEASREKDATNLNLFFEALVRYLHGPKVYAVVPPINSAYKGYDHKRLGELSDAVVVMAYGYEDPAIPTGTAPWDKVDEAIRLETEVVPKDKIILGIPGYGTKYSISRDGATLQAWPAARDAVGEKASVTAFSPKAASESVSWQEDGATYEAFIESNRSLQARVSLAKRYGLSGVAIWRLGLLSEGWWDSVQEVVEPAR
jgi:hypothetical protein